MGLLIVVEAFASDAVDARAQSDPSIPAGLPGLGRRELRYARPVSTTPDTDERAGVTYEAPHGTDSVVLSDTQVAEFGRAGSCSIRFGYAPVADLGVPRVAGRLVVAAGRVFVEALDVVGRSALEITAVGRPPVMLAAGDAFAPSESAFRVTVHGQVRSWPLDVVVRTDARLLRADSSDEPTRTHALSLTDGQRRIIDAYMDPLRRGRLEPATHREVAAALGCHPNSAREVLYSVWSSLFAEGVPMPDVADKRVAVVEAIRLHRLLS